MIIINDTYREKLSMSHRACRRNNQRVVIRLAAFIFPLIYAANSYSKPDMTPLGPNIADKGSSFYHFSVSTFDSADGNRHYKVWTGVPDKHPPASGYAVLYMLDGNAVMDRLTDAFLNKLTQGTPPVLIVIGYQTVKPFELTARTYDYTPPLRENDGEVGHGEIQGRKSGGSLNFRRLLEETIAPKAEKGLSIDAHKRAIWGHSYGGLFVLDSFVNSTFFNGYYSASPSLNSDYIVLLSRLEKINTAHFPHKQLYFMEGSAAPRKKADGEEASAVLNQVRSTLSSLNHEGLAATFWAYPGLSHGEMFNVSFQRALLTMAADNVEKQPLPPLQ